jgi:hypothetical protein
MTKFISVKTIKREPQRIPVAVIQLRAPVRIPVAATVAATK